MNRSAFTTRRRHLLAVAAGFGLLGDSLASSGGSAEPDFDSMLKPQFGVGDAGCAVLVQRGGKTLWRAAYGSSGRSPEQAIAPESQFRIGSITKTFTAVLALRLVDAGKLDLDTPVGDALTDWPRELPAFTLRQLLSHTAGLGQYTELPEFKRQAARGFSSAELLALCAKTPRIAAPGERYIYSNTGYALIGCLIEAVGGRPFEKAIHDEVLRPLGMADTGFEDQIGSKSRLVLGHGRRMADGTRAPVPAVHSSGISASGGLISTVDDLAKWNAATTTGQLLRPATAALMNTPVRLSDGRPAPTGLGWMLRELQGQTALEHSGSTQGFIGHLLYLPAGELFVAVLMNESSGRQPGPGYLCEQLAAAALGKVAADWAVIELPQEALQQLLGDYGEPEVRRHMELYQGRLMVRRGPSRALLEALSPTHFIDRRRGVVHYKFQVDGKGDAKVLTIQREGSPDLTLVRQ
ncbi:serine hydrolase domain-containing protein [Roseateles sp. DB2]|uniref:serine hydrolase domain-containing protein n=1 Tax=Roseateles sp. DB2 TaxID=3453717 RepID=UPI003EE91901